MTRDSKTFKAEIHKITYDDSTRMRTDLVPKEIEELAESLNTVGQLNPVIIMEDYSLRAGRRRIEAAKLLKWTHIECKMFRDLSPLEQAMIEFDENYRRKQMTWQEESKAVTRIHELLKQQKYDWTAKETAEKIGLSQAKVVEDINLAEAADAFENVAKRPSKKGALKAMYLNRELELQRELARRRAFKTGITAQGSQQIRGVVYNTDCREILSVMAPDSVDLILTDPPWGVNFDAASIWTKDWNKQYEDSPEEIEKLMNDVAPLLYKVLKPCCHFYCFFPIQHLQHWCERFEKAGFQIRTRPLVWLKIGSQSITDIHNAFLPSYETFLFGWKPGPSGISRLLGRPTPDGFAYPRQPTIYHPNEKPPEILEAVIEASSEIEELILDPFSGGGSTLAASFILGRYYIGIEKDAVSHKNSVDRLTSLEQGNDQDDDA